MVSAEFADRPLKTLCLFDVDGTLSLARQHASPEMIKTLRALRKIMVIGFVGGSDLSKITEQVPFDEFDYAFAENGVVAFKLGKALPSKSFITFLGEEKYKPLVNFILHYIADLDTPVKRGTFVEFRTSMINVTPLGRNATIQERLDFQALDLKMGYRTTLVKALQEKFPDYGLTYSIGGQISIDVFPNGWDKTYALGRVADEHFDEIHFFGDKTYKGGNDYEIFNDPRTIGHAVTNPGHTIQIIEELFLKN